MMEDLHISKIQLPKTQLGVVSDTERGLNRHAHDPWFSLTDILPYSEVEIEAKFYGTGNLPAFRGVSLRGGLGYHLKKTVCHVRSNTCSACMVRSSCIYRYIFEGVAPQNRTIMRLYPYVPQPFVILTELDEPAHVSEGNAWKFGLRLFGRAIDHFPYIAYALMELGKNGLGKERIKFNIEKIIQADNPNPIFESGSNRISTLKRQYLQVDYENLRRTSITIQFLTPARLRIGGNEARKVNFSEIIRSAIRRLTILTYFYGIPSADIVKTSELVGKSTKIVTKRDETKWFEFERYSGRQSRKISLGGLVGKISFAGELGQFYPILAFTQITNIGKATSFGFGRIAVS